MEATLIWLASSLDGRAPPATGGGSAPSTRGVPKPTRHRTAFRLFQGRKSAVKNLLRIAGQSVALRLQLWESEAGRSHPCGLGGTGATDPAALVSTNQPRTCLPLPS